VTARIEVEGDREVRRALKRLGDAAKAGLRATHAESAEIVAEAARGIVPRRSGVLAASIRSSGQIGAGVVRAGRAAVPYAGVIHFGWAAHSIAPQPFLYDAADARTDEVLAKFHEDINKQARAAGLDVSTGGITT
jgi:hypothetical protein